jgi:CRP-like cAMP-binding protein
MEPPDKMYCPRQVDIFADLDPAEMAEIDRMMVLTTYERGRTLYAPDERREVLFMLKMGRVEIYRLSPEGRKLVIASIGPGSFFGEMALVGQGMYDSFAEAVENSTVCVMTRSDVERLLLAKPKVALRFLETVGQRLKDSETRLEEMAFKNARSRLASLLLQLCQGRDTVDLSHQDLADRLGFYRETVTNVLDQFKANGLIETGRRKITIVSSDELEHIAHQ